MSTRHIDIYNQNITKDIFEGISLTGDFLLPALIFGFENGSATASKFTVFKNSNNLKDGDTSLYVRVIEPTKGKFVLVNIGKVKYGIDIVYSIETIFIDYVPLIYYADSTLEDRVIVTSQTLLGTIEL